MLVVALRVFSQHRIIMTNDGVREIPRTAGKPEIAIDRLLTSPRLLGDQRHRQRGLIRLPSTVTLDGLP